MKNKLFIIVSFSFCSIFSFTSCRKNDCMPGQVVIVSPIEGHIYNFRITTTPSFTNNFASAEVSDEFGNSLGKRMIFFPDDLKIIVNCKAANGQFPITGDALYKSPYYHISEEWDALGVR